MTKDDDCGANVVLRIAVFVFRVGTGSLVIDSIYIYIIYTRSTCQRIVNARTAPTGISKPFSFSKERKTIEGEQSVHCSGVQSCVAITTK
mmetsp:Transcript_22767/g.48363  ORF Transcript_22767/g.48363 Transcript_22767/m.48363 type:complete len:90 (-) Transcript_22767:274-543(-)